MVSPAQEAIALLIEMTERGEIDPWDVQVIAVIDRCLNELAPFNETSSYEADLSESGQAFLYASMLVLLKAESLAASEDEAETESSPEILTLETDPTTQLPLHLERQLRRCAVAQPKQKRPVSLTELIAQLQQLAQDLQDKPQRPTHRRPRPQSGAQAARDITELAHQENLSETAGELEQFLREKWPDLAPETDWLDLEQLLLFWKTHRPQTTVDLEPKHSDRVGVFWALLLLSAQSKVELVQTEFYSDLKIRPLSELPKTADRSELKSKSANLHQHNLKK